MEDEEKRVTKLCSFYVSDWHLVTMLLPYINQKINEKAQVATILEKSIEQNISTLVEKLRLKNKEKILEINWKQNEKILKNINKLQEKDELIIFINGTKDFITKQNRKLIKYLNAHLIKNNIKIINCYEVIEFDGNIENILDEHDGILNTSGEKQIEEVFKDYKKNNNEEKKAVV